MKIARLGVALMLAVGLVACGGGSPSGPTSAPVSAPTPAPPCDGDPCTVFVTSTSTTGNIGGVAGADAICAAQANAAGLSGRFLAWLSDTRGASPSARFNKSLGAYRLVDGTQIASSYADLTDGRIAAPINLDEFGEPVMPPLSLGPEPGRMGRLRYFQGILRSVRTGTVPLRIPLR